MRLELQAEKGDTQVLYDGHTLTVYDASSNTLYRYTPPAGQQAQPTRSPTGDKHEVPSVAKIEEAIAKLRARQRLRRDADATSPASPPTRCASRRRKAAA